jgi:hypothetical protein
LFTTARRGATKQRSTTGREHLSGEQTVSALKDGLAIRRSQTLERS